MNHLNIDGHNFYCMVVNACNRLEQNSETINSLNVFPVPDGDTGTNMFMTFKSAVSEIQNYDNKSISEISKELAKGALMGARGNSGVILSQILRGISSAFEGKEKVDAKVFSNCLMEGSKSAYKAVMRPTEGTILTIIKAAGDSAVNCKKTDITELMEEVCRYSETVLNKTPDMLPVLKKAKVVDAGGMGLLVILKGMYEALSKDIEPTLNEIKPTSKLNNAFSNLGKQEIKYGYCTELLISAKSPDIEFFKGRISSHGDSMLVVSSDDIIKVHIHTNDPGYILSRAVEIGELLKVKVENMRQQHRNLLFDDQKTKNSTISNQSETLKKDERKKYGFIAVALGEGIKDIFKDIGADIVVEGGQTMNPSTQDILDSINKLNVENIIILPNNKNIIMAANQAVQMTNKKVNVVPTKSISQGIAALTAFNSEFNLNENLNSISKSIENVKSGSVTYAVRDTEIEGTKINKNDILGLVEEKITEVGSDMYDICEKIISSMVKEDSELITIFYGMDCDENKVNDFIKKIQEKYKDIDVECYNGKQSLYYFLVSVE